MWKTYARGKFYVYLVLCSIPLKSELSSHQKRWKHNGDQSSQYVKSLLRSRNSRKSLTLILIEETSSIWLTNEDVQRHQCATCITCVLSGGLKAGSINLAQCMFLLRSGYRFLFPGKLGQSNRDTEFLLNGKIFQASSNVIRVDCFEACCMTLETHTRRQ